MITFMMFMVETKKQINVLGEELEECSNNLLTGWFTELSPTL
jgi:uncharacterized protein (DUF2237 family)